LEGGVNSLKLRCDPFVSSGHTPDQTRLYAALAQRHDLLMTGGSDFHGAIQPEIEMGSGQGDLIVPYELFEKLIQH
jgi:hypothetical protein